LDAAVTASSSAVIDEPEIEDGRAKNMQEPWNCSIELSETSTCTGDVTKDQPPTKH
jgi:hypothetical protein